jgi:hypothetical protein
VVERWKKVSVYKKGEEEGKKGGKREKGVEIVK